MAENIYVARQDVRCTPVSKFFFFEQTVIADGTTREGALANLSLAIDSYCSDQRSSRKRLSCERQRTPSVELKLKLSEKIRQFYDSHVKERLIGAGKGAAAVGFVAFGGLALAGVALTPIGLGALAAITALGALGGAFFLAR